jgi:hypothetical protein
MISSNKKFDTSWTNIWEINSAVQDPSLSMKTYWSNIFIITNKYALACSKFRFDCLQNLPKKEVKKLWVKIENLKLLLFRLHLQDIMINIFEYNHRLIIITQTSNFRIIKHYFPRILVTTWRTNLIVNYIIKMNPAILNTHNSVTLQKANTWIYNENDRNNYGFMWNKKILM